ncbi:calcium-binding protein, partial [Asticcacaulis biprosthecium]|uniref:calcium-binding protein n=1 Tax=Asticcacaulis biprosthecium TaxID=76891 RepID=UPI00145F5992
TNKDKLILTGSDDIDGTGNSLDNILVGNAGMNRLNGGTGADTMFGGGEDDLYIVDNVGDVASEQTVEGIDDGGFDTVRSSVSYTLGAYIENLRLTGSGNINATGNSSANYLFGNAGNNALDGSFGGDIMDGGLGNDTYYVNVGTDEVIEYAAGGTDTVVSQVSYTLGDNLENISLASWGTAATNAWGNAVANVVTGGRGSNQLYGLDGADTIVGGEGNDTIDGGNGADSMSGGLGSDVYYVNDASDVVFEDAG